MDIAICLDRLVPAADYFGSTNSIDETAYDNLVWNDQRSKPSWQDIQAEWTEYQNELSLIKEYRLWSYVPGYMGDKTVRPDRVDFVTGLDRRLLPKHTFQFGELQETVYFLTRTDNPNGSYTYNTPVLKETFSYTRDPETGFPIMRTNRIQWYYTDNTIDPTYKELLKYYDDDPISSLSELARRRDNNIKNIIGSLIMLVLLTDPEMTRNEVIDQGRMFFQSTEERRQLYIQDGNPAIVDDVRNESSLTWMDNNISALIPGLTTIRSFIIYQLTFGQQVS